MSILFYVLGTAFSLTAAVAICIVFTLGSFDTNTAVAQLDSSLPNVPEIEQTEAASRGPASATSLVRISADYPMLSPTPDLAEPANTPVLRATRVSLIADAAHRDQTPPRVPLPPIRKAGPTVGKANSLTADVANPAGRSRAAVSRRDRSNQSSHELSYSEEHSNPLSAIAEVFGMR